MASMQYGDVPEARIGLGVRARIETRRGGEYFSIERDLDLEEPRIGG